MLKINGQMCSMPRLFLLSMIVLVVTYYLFQQTIDSGIVPL